MAHLKIDGSKPATSNETLRKPILAIFLLVVAYAHSQARAAVWQPSPGHVQVPIWRGAVPDAMPNPKPEAVGPPEGREWWPRANDVSRSTITVYAAKRRNTVAAVVGRREPSARVPADSPPTFLLQAEDDHVDSVKESLAYYVALQKAGVPTEMHLDAQGGHAFGLRPSKLAIAQWPRLVELWPAGYRLTFSVKRLLSNVMSCDTLATESWGKLLTRRVTRTYRERLPDAYST